MMGYSLQYRHVLCQSVLFVNHLHMMKEIDFNQLVEI